MKKLKIGDRVRVKINTPREYDAYMLEDYITAWQQHRTIGTIIDISETQAEALFVLFDDSQMIWTVDARILESAVPKFKAGDTVRIKKYWPRQHWDMGIPYTLRDWARQSIVGTVIEPETSGLDNVLVAIGPYHTHYYINQDMLVLVDTKMVTLCIMSE